MGLCPRPYWRNLQSSTDSLVWLGTCCTCQMVPCEDISSELDDTMEGVHIHTQGESYLTHSTDTASITDERYFNHKPHPHEVPSTNNETLYNMKYRNNQN